jgi:hypothetical protein
MDIFSLFPVRAQDVTANFIHAEIEIHQKDLFTGVFHISGKSQLVFLFAQGRLVSVYKLTDGDWSTLSRSGWDAAIAECSGNLRIANIAAEGVRLLRLFLESDLTESKLIPSMPASELTACVNGWQRGDKAGLVALRQSGAGALMLFPPGETSSAEAVLMTDSQTQTGMAAINQVRAWGSRPCEVLLCVGKLNSEAWKEYSLRVSFGQFIQLLLRRYGELAGQFLVTDLNEQVNGMAQSWDMALSFYGTKLSNRHFFESMERAGQAYVTVFGAMGEQMKEVVGEKMLTDIRKEAIMQLELDNRILVQEYVISRLEQG